MKIELVLVHDAGGLADRHLGGTAHDDPMFGPMIMTLQGQLGVRLDHDPFNLESIPLIKRIKKAPGPVAPPVQNRLAATLFF